MKKLALLMMLCGVVAVNALTYRQTACLVSGLNPATAADTLSITFQQRVLAMNACLCSEVSRGIIVKTDFTNNAQFTDAQLNEFVVRGLNSGISTVVVNQMAASINVQSNGLAVTDAQLKTAWLNVMWGVLCKIGSGSL